MADVPAVVVSAAAFAVLHFSILALPFLFVMGLLLGWLRLHTGSIIPPITAHFFHNLVMLLLGVTL
jgi:membrane protease YdiL (CAAX protease family)